jgi:uncharacterized protein YjiK
MGIFTINLFTHIVLVTLSLNDFAIPFNIAKPEIKIELSRELKEISGLSWFSDDELATIQDESGMVYLLDANTGVINRKIQFSLPGDFEGIEVVGNTFYAITSSGTLYKFNINQPKDAQRIKTPLSWKNDVEGLTYDKVNNQLLIACKEQGSISGNEIKGKAVYALSLDDHTLSPEPIILLKKSNLKKFVDVKKFHPSAVAIDPLTNNVYVLASSGKLLVVLDESYKIVTAIKLSSKVYKQPEGICFSPKGDLYISNEGGNGKGNFYHLLRK